jgi:ATP-dependent DNA helicase RecG
MRFPAFETITPQVESPVNRLLQVLQGEVTRKELQQALWLADKDHFREAILRPAL